MAIWTWFSFLRQC